MISGLSQKEREDAKRKTKKWQKKVAEQLTYLQRRDMDGEHCDSGVAKIEYHLRLGKKQSSEQIETIFSKAQDRILAYQSKVIRMALETCARQVLANAPIAPVYVLPFPVIKSQFLRLANKISKSEINRSMSEADICSLDGHEKDDREKDDG